MPRFLRREAGAEVDRLYRRYADEVLRYALLVLRSRTDAEDITQTVFLRALRAIERGEKVRTPRNWLIKIAHNECRRLLASRKVHSELPDEIAVEPVERGRAEELKVAMDALPATQRQALVLRELEGRTYDEIARTLDISVSAVETLIFRARRALREQIENAITCEQFAALLDDPSARSRLRAHARICPECATLDHQSRGRKSALKRIASALGFPGWGTWWGAKIAAVAVTTASVASVSAAVPHDPVRPSVPSVPSAQTTPAPSPIRASAAPTPALSTGLATTTVKHAISRHAQATGVPAAPKQVAHKTPRVPASAAQTAVPAAAAPAPAPAQAPAAATPAPALETTAAPTAQHPPHPQHPQHPSHPAKPAAPRASPHRPVAVPAVPPVHVPGPPVKVPGPPQGVPGPPVGVPGPPVGVPHPPDPPGHEVPNVTVPTVSVPAAVPAPPAVTVPVGLGK